MASSKTCQNIFNQIGWMRDQNQHVKPLKSNESSLARLRRVIFQHNEPAGTSIPVHQAVCKRISASFPAAYKPDLILFLVLYENFVGLWALFRSPARYPTRRFVGDTSASNGHKPDKAACSRSSSACALATFTIRWPWDACQTTPRFAVKIEL